jgi:hypothetical protein
MIYLLILAGQNKIKALSEYFDIIFIKKLLTHESHTLFKSWKSLT